ncbi:MAG TPA: glycerol-3-phosphate dehydrogenase/oxidase [Candidatus Polarisedimenticolaceae bacterium]|nr:glycerol-3-phosphate dehydrogenase/oxidase [Candidatus Polarisedimenticolaceae bacterium]
MDRDRLLERLERSDEPWDFIIVGGGATGLGALVDAASRGYRAVLLEQHDFAKATSSRSTKLIHGGVRYLKEGNVSLVLEALRERGFLYRNAPHLVRNMAFVIPVYSWWEGPFYGIGMKVYDRLAGRLGFNPSHTLTREETIERIPTVETDGLLRGVVYHDGQFDDARLAIELARTAAELGGCPLNYMRVERLIDGGGLLRGVVARELEGGSVFEIEARAVINATGVFADELRRLDTPDCVPMLAPSQGTHLVLPKAFLPGDSAILVPRTDDGRVLFAVPWHDHVVVGTTDTAVDRVSLEPRASAEEIEFLLTNAARYLSRDPGPRDVLSVFSGLRPLVARGGAQGTANLSRDHSIVISNSGLVTITGGKWTTYRKMAEEVIDRAEIVADLDHRPCRTETLPIHGHCTPSAAADALGVYGYEAAAIRALVESDPTLGRPLAPGVAVIGAQVVWAVRREMARTVEDVLARRTRALLLGARASAEAADPTATLMARELGRDESWCRRTVQDYRELARGYELSV